MATFPLTLVFEIYVNGAWVDITSDVRYEAGAAIGRGRADEQSSVSRSRCGFEINTRDGKYSPRNPNSEYYGKIGRNTPFRVRVEDTFPTPTLANINTVSFNGASFAMAPPVDVVAGNVLIAFHSADATTLASMLEPTPNPSTVPTPWLLLDSAYTDASNDLATKVWWRVAGDDEPASYTFTQDASSDGVATIVSIANAGHATPIVAQTLESAPGASVDTPTLTPVSNNDFELRWVAMTDATGAANTWTPPAGFDERSDWQSRTFTSCSLATRPRTSGAAGGVHTFTASSAAFDSAHGFTVSIMPDEVRFSGEIPSWPPKWDVTGTDVYVPIEASGILRRLGQGASPLRSALFRELSINTDLVAYWPLEDGARAASFASGLPGGIPATVDEPSGPDAIRQGGSSTAGVGTAPLPVLIDTTIRARVPTHSATEWTVGALFYFDGEPDSNFLVWSAVGTLTTWEMSSTAGSDDISLRVFDSDFNTVINATFDPETPLDDRWIYVVCSATQNGSDVDYTFGYSDGTTTESLIGSATTETLGAVSDLLINPGNATGCPVGHVFVSDVDIPFPGPGAAAMLGHAGETAVDRLIRVADEEGIYLEVIGESATSEVVGVQRVATLLDLLNDAADADQGILYEPRDRFGLAYRTRASLYNQTATLALDYSLAHLSGSLEPVDDDQHVRNDVTVERLDGSEARAVQETGALSILAPPDGVGRYDEKVTLNVESDGQLQQIAAWRRHIGTWDGARYPTMGVNLARSVFTASAALSLAAAKVDLGDYISLDNPPAWLPPDLVEQLAQGLREYLNPFEWSITWNTSPAGPYLVMGVYGTSRYDTAGSELAEDLTTTETLLDVTTTLGPLWADPGAGSFDIGIGGERITVTNVAAPVGNTQTFTTTRSVNGVVKTHSTGAAVSLWRPARYAL